MEIVVILLVVGFVIWRTSRSKEGIAGPSEIGAVGWTAGTDWAVARPLARADTRRLVRHPAFIVGVVLTPLMFWAATSNEPTWLDISGAMALALVVLAWTTIVATNLLALQPRRTGADELLAAAPAPQPVRTTGLLLTAVGAAAVAAVLAGAWIAMTAVTGDTPGSPALAELGAGLLIVAGGATVGVGVARWMPHLGFGVMAVFAVSFLQARFMDPSTWPWNLGEAHPGRFLGFLAEPTSTGVVLLEVRPAGWHLVYLGGLVLLMSVVALSRDGFPRALLAMLAAAVVVIVGAGWAQFQPPSPQQVATMVDYLNNPTAHQTCTEVGQTTLCAYPEQRERVDQWSARAEAIRDLLPPNVADRDLAITDRVPVTVGNEDCGTSGFLDELHPAVVDEVTPGAIWPDDGAVHPGTNRFPCGGRSVNELFTAMQVGSWAVGLPPSPHGLDVRCQSAGQARAVLALWLAGAVTPDSRPALGEIAKEHAGDIVSFDAWDDPPMLGTTFAAADVELATALLALPTKRVAAAVADAWSALTSPATPASAVADLFDIEAQGAALDRGPTACR